MSKLSMFIWLLLKAIGFLALYSAAFLTEVEDGAIQSRVEEWWVKITDRRNAALSSTAAFMQQIAQLTQTAFNRIYGVRPVSTQMFLVSFYFSLASLCLLPIIKYENQTFQLGSPLRSLMYFISFVGVGLVPAFSPIRWIVTLWYFLAVVMFLKFLHFTFFCLSAGPRQISARHFVFLWAVAWSQFHF